jgi:hypothetical protein
MDVIAERKRQIEAEGWTSKHDDEHIDGEMAQAAAVYAAPHEIRLAVARPEFGRQYNAWPWWQQDDVSGGRGDTPVWVWAKAWFKPKDRRSDLVRAAALIIAEIERLDRASDSSNSDDDTEHCIACDEAFKEGDPVFNDASGGLIHAVCCGPERASYCGPDGAALQDNEPIPLPFAWKGI